MFAPPPLIEAEIFGQLPTRYSNVGRTSGWLQLQLRGAAMGSFLEGPSFDRDGNLYVVDIPYGRIFRITQEGEFSLALEYDGEPNGLKFHSDGRAYVADHKNGLMVFDPQSSKIEPILDRPVLERFRGLNDLTFAKNGDLYFTDQGQSGLQDPSGRLYRLKPDGNLECLLDNVPSPNGLVMDADQGSLLLAVTRANSVWRVPLLLDGQISKVGVFVNLSGGFGPDGLAMDQDGNLAVCHPGMGVVWMFKSTGEPLYRIQSCRGLLVTNCVFGDPDQRSLYITEAETGSILVARVPPSS